jgi:hypothetical protein
MYGVIGRLAMLAASYELEATDPDAEPTIDVGLAMPPELRVSCCTATRCDLRPSSVLHPVVADRRKIAGFML